MPSSRKSSTFKSSRKKSSRTSRKTSQKNKTRKSSAKSIANKTVISQSFRDSIRNSISEDYFKNNSLDLDEVAEIEEKRVSEIKPKLIKDIKSIESAIRKNNQGGFILFGDSHHGDLAFDFIVKMFPSLNKEFKSILKKAHYFSENAYQMNELKNKGYGQKFIGLDDGTKVSAGKYDELKRNHQANTTWPEIILNNLSPGLNIISVGRSHIYAVKAKKEDSRLQKVDSFQDVLKSKTSKPITVFTMNNNLDLNYDNYKEYAATHQLDEVIDNPKIRSIFAF